MKKKFTVLLISLLALTGCTSWYGTGTVVTKQHEQGYYIYVTCGKATCPIYQPECYKVVMESSDGETHSGCISAKDWEKAEVGEELTLVPPE